MYFFARRIKKHFSNSSCLLQETSNSNGPIIGNAAADSTPFVGMLSKSHQSSVPEPLWVEQSRTGIRGTGHASCVTR